MLICFFIVATGEFYLQDLGDSYGLCLTLLHLCQIGFIFVYEGRSLKKLLDRFIFLFQALGLTTRKH